MVFSNIFLNVGYLLSLSSSVTKERSTPRDLLNPSKKDSEFRSIFQHIQSTQLRRSPSELFAQHLVSIVHYIKGTVRAGLGLFCRYRGVKSALDFGTRCPIIREQMQLNV